MPTTPTRRRHNIGALASQRRAAPRAPARHKPGSTLAGPSVTFSWTTAAGATGYYLWLGSTGVGTHNLYSSGLQAGNSVTPPALPTNGESIYARLFTA